MTICIDKKYGQIDAILEKYNYHKSMLVPILQETQAIYNYLPEELLEYVADKLKIPVSRVYGVATFYSHFALKPKGKYIIKICDGTACHVKGSLKLLDSIKAKLKLTQEKNTTDDMLFTLETVSCLGACGLAPAVVINEEVFGQMTPDKICREIDLIIKKEGE